MINFLKLPDIEGRTFFVGDIHGEYTRLMQQLEDIGFDFYNDRLIATGDIIDRGSEVIPCIGLLNETWFYSVLGNHELMLIEGIDDQVSYSLHLNNGGDWLYDVNDEVRRVLEGLVRSRMPLCIQATAAGKEIGVVHATSLSDWAKTSSGTSRDHYDEITWDFKKAARAEKGNEVGIIEGIDLVVSGHYCTEEPVAGGNHVWIDTFSKSGRFSIVSAEQAISWVAE